MTILTLPELFKTISKNRRENPQANPVAAISLTDAINASSVDGGADDRYEYRDSYIVSKALFEGVIDWNKGEEVSLSIPRVFINKFDCMDAIIRISKNADALQKIVLCSELRDKFLIFSALEKYYAQSINRSVVHKLSDKLKESSRVLSKAKELGGEASNFVYFITQAFADYMSSEFEQPSRCALSSAICSKNNIEKAFNDKYKLILRLTSGNLCRYEKIFNVLSLSSAVVAGVIVASAMATSLSIIGSVWVSLLSAPWLMFAAAAFVAGVGLSLPTVAVSGCMLECSQGVKIKQGIEGLSEVYQEIYNIYENTRPINLYADFGSNDSGSQNNSNSNRFDYVSLP